MLGNRRLIGHAGGVLVAKELDVATERNGRDLPAGAVAIIEADSSGPKPIENVSTFTPHQRATKKMPELVEEHHDGQDEQKRKDVAEDAAADRTDTRT